MSVIELDKPLEIPSKLLPLITRFNDYRYFVIEGGRGGGKSNAVARFILYLAEMRNLRVVCGREIQKNIKESVYSLLADLIDRHHMDYSVGKSAIISNVSLSEINFRGFREQEALNIQGMEGVDIVWVDEAQAITKETLDKLKPTIRQDTAKIIFTMNRHVPHDPVFEDLVGRADTLHIHLNYDDNPYCTKALITEASECRKKSEKDYRHIWLGEPLAQAEDALFSMEELEATIHRKKPSNPYYGYKVGGFDIARFGDDKNACVILEQTGALTWSVIHVQEWEHKDTNWTAGEINRMMQAHKLDEIIVDVDGLGVGPFDQLKFGRDLDMVKGFRNPVLSMEKDREYANNRTKNAYLLKDYVQQGHLAIDDKSLMKELCTLKYTFDHNQRRILVSKDNMKKQGFKSPNMADALIMAMSLVPGVKGKQDTQYAPKRTQPQGNANLFKLAGVS